MSSIKHGKKLQHRAQFELCEPRLLMTAQPNATPDFHVDYYVGGAASSIATQGNAATTSAAAYYQSAIDQVRAQYGLTGAGQTVVTIDTGMAYDDAALGGGFGSGYRVVGGWDFAENDADPFDDGPAGSHGTHVAGIIGSSDPNHFGVAPGVDLVSLRVFDDGGAGWFSWIDSALDWVYDHRDSFRSPITTVNLSLGATWNSTDLPAWANLENDFRMLKQVGIFISVAAGNSFGDYGTPGLSYPAASPYVVPVMSSGDGEGLSWFSQRLDRAIAAPGEGITSSVPDYVGDHNGVDDDWANYSGTSMSAAYMSGAAVIVRQAFAQAGRTSVDEDAIYSLMRSTADRVFDAATGANYLVLNLKNAVDAALSGPVDHEGNTAASAVNLGALDLRNTVSGSVDVAGDQDFFRFTAMHSGKVTISISRDAGLNTRWQLVNTNGSLRNLSGSSITLQVTAGRTYTFGVQGTSGLGEYDLTMQLTPSFMGLGVVNTRTMNNQRVSGERWYRFQAAHAGTLALMSKVPNGTAGVTIELYNSAMQKLGTSTGECTDLLSVAANCGSAYYIRLVGVNSRVQLKLGCGASASKITGLATASVASVDIGSAGERNQAPVGGNAEKVALTESFSPRQVDAAAPDASAIHGVQLRAADDAGFDELRLRSITDGYTFESRQHNDAIALVHSESNAEADSMATSDASMDDVFDAALGELL